MRCKWFVALLAHLMMASSGWSAVIVVGNHPLVANTPGQTIQIFVSGGDAVQGMNLYAQVADGGPDAGGTIVGPTITGVNILSGTIFASNNTGSQDPGSLAQLAARTTTTSSGTVSASGLLATLTIDTTGFSTGTWALNLGDTQNGPTDFAGVSISITDGSISVPEPEAAYIVACIIAMVYIRSGRTRSVDYRQTSFIAGSLGKIFLGDIQSARSTEIQNNRSTSKITVAGSLMMDDNSKIVLASRV